MTPVDLNRLRQALRVDLTGCVDPEWADMAIQHSRPVTDADLASLGYIHLSEPVPHNEAWAEWAQANGWVKLDGIDVEALDRANGVEVRDWSTVEAEAVYEMLDRLLAAIEETQ